MREGSEEADLLVDLGDLIAAGIGDDEVSAALDDVSRQILENVILREYVDDSGAIHLVIG